jgi:cbb3-type cytochrome oxidase maturation protein
METLYLLIPISLAMIALIIGALLWAIKSGQFDDLEGPAHEILMDNDDVNSSPSAIKQADKKSNK